MKLTTESDIPTSAKGGIFFFSDNLRRL